MNIPECPTLTPTEEEFEYPIRYLSSENILSLGTYYGIVKVKPPPGWEPKFALDFNSFKFQTRLQELPELSLRNRARVDFLRGFNCFQKFNDRSPLLEDGDVYIGVSKPTIDFERVNKYGWIHLLDNSRIHIHDIFISRDWQRWIALAVNKRLISNVIEYSQYIITALNLERDLRWNINTDNAFDQYTSLSPETDSHLMRYYKEPNDKNLYIPLNQPLKSILRNIESFIYNELKKDDESEDEEKPEEDIYQEGSKPLTYSINIKNYTPTIEIISNIQNKENGKLTIGPTISEETLKSIIKLSESCSICHLSDKPNLILECENCEDLYHMTCLTPKLTAIPVNGWYCSSCLVGGSGDYGFEHDDKKWSLNEFQFWINDNWGSGSKGKNWVNSLKRGVGNSNSESNMTATGLTEHEMEGLFWSLISGKVELPDGLKIRYGADINNEINNEISGFPTESTVNGFKKSNGEFIKPNLSTDQSKYVKSEWNLINLPFAKGSFFKYICNTNEGRGNVCKEDIINIHDEDEEIEIDSRCSQPASLNPPSISGMSVPWLYVGGPFSTFCWHKEDHYTMSANYSHLGSPKQWYGIPSECCEEFERRVKELIGPDIGRKQSDLMHQLVSQIPLEDIYLGDATMRIYKATQRKGEFIVTFPRVYHSGFNYGFNVNEAVNFTNVEWMKFSPMAIREYKKVKKEPVFDILDTIKNVLNDSEQPEEFCKDNWITRGKLNDTRKVGQLIYQREVEEIDRIKNTFINKEGEITVGGLLGKMRSVTVADYLKEVGKDQFITREICKIVDEDNKDDEDEKVDLGICQKCKTRVHVEWVDIDMWKDWIVSVNEDVKRLEKDILNAVESKIDDEQVKIPKIDGEGRGNPKRVKLSLDASLRRARGQLKKNRRIVLWLSNKRLMDNGFGHIILCLQCFRGEIAQVDHGSVRRVIEASTHVAGKTA